ncbi:Latent-transforming growth factor beta-binding 2 [Paramuricea clavata]|nr:Latent-transforming growth factor beta-binding 2 [Paramuricea clavata]
MFYTLPPVKGSVTVHFTDRIVAKSLRVSLKKTDAVSWLGEICVEIILFDVEYWKGEKTSCEKGFYGDGKFCIDINECADNTGNFCPPRQHCIDSAGTYSCPGTCLENKLPNKRTGVCEDHCYHKGYLCHPKARCLYGKCVCDSGYEGDGSYCLDSCTAKGFTCDSNANCAEGKCKCRDGFKGNGEICQAICHFNLKLCHPSAVCHTNACKCKPGYVGDGISKCIFSRKLYEKEMKKQRMVQTRLDIVETDVFEVLHAFQRLRSILNQAP